MPFAVWAQNLKLRQTNDEFTLTTSLPGEFDA